MENFPIEGADYFIYYMTFPPGIYAFIMPNEDGTYSMFLDPRHDFWHQIDDWEHEIWHLLRDDLYSDKPVWVVEAS